MEHIFNDVEFSTDEGKTWRPLGTVRMSNIESLGPVPPKVRLYNVFWVRGQRYTRPNEFGSVDTLRGVLAYLACYRKQPGPARSDAAGGIVITREQEDALLLLADALDACNTAQAHMFIPGRSYVNLEVGCCVLECLDLSDDDEFTSAGLRKSIAYLSDRHN